MQNNDVNVIEVEKLTHQFGEFTALHELSFTVQPGKIFAMLGPNGAGKTTTIRLLNGLYRSSKGRIQVLGLDPQAQGKEVRQQTGVLTETNALYERLSARRNLEFFGRLYGMQPVTLQKRIDELLRFFNLEDRADEKVGVYSKGMKQRLSLARAMLNRPKILFLDEPTSSLDPESTQQVHELIRSIREKDGHTVFLCTHHLEEAERLADQVAILNAGQLLALGSLEELNRQFNHGLWVEVELLQPFNSLSKLQQMDGIIEAEQEEKRLRVKVKEEAVLPILAAELVHNDAQILSLQPRRVTLEDIYFRLQENARKGA